VKLLLIGDPHVTVEELSDCQALLDLVIGTARQHHPDYVVFLGDLHHGHAVVRVEVMDFWKRNLAVLGQDGQKSILLVGNHDRPNNVNLKMDALAYESPTTHVVSEPEAIGDVRFIPWTHSNEEFIAACGDAKVIFAHQEFKGGRFDNGMWIPNGVDPDSIPATAIVSGHIHRPAQFGKTWYPGSPRWRTASDANVDRAIWLVEVAGGDVKCNASGFIPTRGICRALYHIEDVESIGSDKPSIIQPARVTVNIRGSVDYVNARKAFWAGQGASVATFPTQETVRDVRESDGLPRAIQKHLAQYKPKYGTPAEVLAKMVQERVQL
jgi:DNA repair exonuclease SbcCD nuclease subunit